MKIWIAELMLAYYNNRWETFFDFELSDREYKLNKDASSYVYFKNWVGDKVPVNMEVDRTWSGSFKVHQGFDKELNEEELRELENKMKSLLLKRLESEKNEYLKTYEDKVKSIRGVVNGNR